MFQYQTIIIGSGDVRSPKHDRCAHLMHDDVIKWKHFPRSWPFVRGIPRSPVNSPHKGQSRGALMFSLICALSERLSKQWWGWRFETPSRLLWRHCNVKWCSIRLPHRPSLVHYSEFIMSTMASQITGVSIIYSTVCSGAIPKKRSKLRVAGPLWGECTGDRWIPHTKGQ